MEQTQFAELRSFLHTNTPDQTTRQQLYGMLQKAQRKDAARYLAEWWPYIQGFDDWLSEPLMAVYLDGMGGGARPPEDAEWYDWYRAVIPQGPLMVSVGGGDNVYDVPSLSYVFDEAPDTIVGLCVDRPKWNFDGGQDGYGDGDADISVVLQSIQKELLPHLQGLRAVTICCDYYTSYDMTLSGEESSSWHPGNISRLDSAQRLMPILGELQHIVRFQLSAQLQPAKLSHLPKTPWWTSLEWLSLADNKIRQGGIKKLFAQPMPALKTLDLQGNAQFGVGGVKALAKCKSFPVLEVLNLSDCDVTQDDLALLHDSKHLPALRHVIFDT